MARLPFRLLKSLTELTEGCNDLGNDAVYFLKRA